MFTDKYINDGRTKLEDGDVVMCVKTRDDHFIDGKEYKVFTDDCGMSCIFTEYLRRFFLVPKQGGYCSTNSEEHWFRKKEKVMDKWAVKKEHQTPFSVRGYETVDVHGDGSVVLLKEKTEKVLGNSEFKVGEKVFTLNREFGITLATVFSINGDVMLVEHGEGDLLCHNEFTRCGKHYVHDKIKSVIKATSENRKALARFHGEDVVPKLELTGGEAVKHLLKSQKYVLCQVSNFSENHARKGDVVALIDSADMHIPEGSFYDGGDDWDYAVPIDMNKKEIVINLVEEK